jgi:hypothetical protein
MEVARTVDAFNLSAGIAQLEHALKNDRPRDPQFQFALGAAYSGVAWIKGSRERG